MQKFVYDIGSRLAQMTVALKISLEPLATQLHPFKAPALFPNNL